MCVVIKMIFQNSVSFIFRIFGYFHFQGSEKSQVREPEKTQSLKELVLSPELGVFVDKQGNCYNADGVEIDHPGNIRNAQTDFLQISEVFSLSEENENQQAMDSQDKLVTVEKKTPRITVIPEAKCSMLNKPRISIIPEAKTDLMEAQACDCVKSSNSTSNKINRRLVTTRISVKGDLKTPRISVIPEAKCDKGISNSEMTESDTQNEIKRPRISVIPEAKTDTTPPPLLCLPVARTETVGSSPALTSEPFLPIIVDVRSESIEFCNSPISLAESAAVTTLSNKELNNKSNESCDGPVLLPESPAVTTLSNKALNINSDEFCNSPVSLTESTAATTLPNKELIVKSEPTDVHSNGSQDDDDTLTASETNSNIDNILGIIDNIPETEDNFYVDVPEFVQINNFSLEDLNNLRNKQQLMTLERITPSPPVAELLTGNETLTDVLHRLKPLPKILPKPDSLRNQNLADQLIASGSPKTDVSNIGNCISQVFEMITYENYLIFQVQVI